MGKTEQILYKGTETANNVKKMRNPLVIRQMQIKTLYTILHLSV